jgi:hypothetical protein
VSYTLREDPWDYALARFELAKALRTAGRGDARARELAESARDDLRKFPGTAAEARAAEHWLEERVVVSTR